MHASGAPAAAMDAGARVRIHASEFLDYAALPGLVNDRLLTRREHPDAPLFIYNYTDRCQYDRIWTNETRQCRGLILDADGYVLARPFEKFFNLGEHEGGAQGLGYVPIGSPFKAFEKLDGSLGIAYHLNGQIQIATRGAFASEQAIWANAWWAKNTSEVRIPEGQTWLFEILYPENRIVVDYKGRTGLVLLAVIDNATGKDLPLPTESEWPGERAEVYEMGDVGSLIASVEDPSNFEGFVLLYETGERVKVKLDEYVRLHRLMSTCSSKSVWELLSNGESLDPVIERVPDEFYACVKRWETDLRAKYRAIESECLRLLPLLTVPGDRKATAINFTQQEHPAVLFKMLDGKDHSATIWKLLRPEYERPYLIQSETCA